MLLKFRLLLVVVVVHTGALIPFAHGQQSCSLCKNDGESITRPNQEVFVPQGASPIPINDCATLDMVAGYVAAGSSDCAGIQLFATICGCAAAAATEASCSLCGTNHSLPNPKLELGSDAYMILADTMTESNDTALHDDGQAFTCEEYDSYLATLDRESNVCVGSDPVRTFCGCPVMVSNNDNSNSQTNNSSTKGDAVCRLCPEGYRLQNATHNSSSSSGGGSETGLSARSSDMNLLIDETIITRCERLLNEEGSFSESQCEEAKSLVPDCGGCVPYQEQGQHENDGADDDDEMCTLCPFGEPSPFPDKTFDFFMTLPDCGTLDGFARSLYKNGSKDCGDIRGFAKICGCRMPESSCSLCRDKPMTKPRAQYYWLKQGNLMAASQSHDSEDSAELMPTHDEMLQSPYSCEVLDSFMASVAEESSQSCLAIQLRGRSCGCPDFRASLAIYIRRTAAGLSLLGSLFILQDVLKDRKRLPTTYHQLLLGVSFFDAIGSIALLFGSIPLPAYSGIDGARGTEETCKALGFFVQLAFTSTYFNLGLSIYFWLMICHNWNENRLKKYRVYAYALILLLGTSLAIGGLPYYVFGFNSCSVYPPPLTSSWMPGIIFFCVPMGVNLFSTTLFSVLVLLEVHGREKATLRFSARASPSGGDRGMYWTRKVFWKSFWYLLAFYVTYPILYATFFIGVDAKDYWLVLLSMALSPLQGLWNALIYIKYRKSSSGKHQSSGSRWTSTSKSMEDTKSLEFERVSSLSHNEQQHHLQFFALEEKSSGDTLQLSTDGPAELRSLTSDLDAPFRDSGHSDGGLA